MIDNNICEKCNHKLVCDKQSTLIKFNSDDKKYIGVDIEIKTCKDYQEAE